MQKLSRLLPSPSMVVAFVALFVAAAGGAVAATKIGSRQIANNSIKSVDVKNRSLLRKDFKPGQLPRGARGAPGAPGPRGATGAAGSPGPPGRDGFGTLAYRFDGIPVPAGEEGVVGVACPDGTSPTGGGAVAQTTGGNPQIVSGASGAFGFNDEGVPVGYLAFFDNTTGGEVDLFVDVACANADTVDLGPIGRARRQLR